AYQREYVAPRTEYEVAVAAAFAEVLGVERVGASDDFFDLGGHSLLATRVASKLRDQFGISLALRVFFEVSTVETVAAALSREIGRSGAGIPRLIPRRVTSVDRVDQLSESELDAMLS